MNTNAEAVYWAIKAKGISLAGFRVLLALASRVNSERGDFVVWPSHARIAEDTEISVASVKRAIIELEEKLYVRKELRLNQSRGGKTSNAYLLRVNNSSTNPVAGKVEIDAEAMVQSELSRQVTGELFDRSNEPKPIAQSELSRQVTGELRIYKDRTLVRGTVEREYTPPPFCEGVSPTTGLQDFVTQGWKALQEQFPSISGIRSIDTSRLQKIKARASAAGGDPVAVWAEIFTRIQSSKFLTGRAPPGRDRADPFKLNIDFVLRPASFLKILEGSYDDKPNSNSAHLEFDPETGRQLSSSEQTARLLVDGVRQGRMQPDERRGTVALR